MGKLHFVSKETNKIVKLGILDDDTEYIGYRRADAGEVALHGIKEAVTIVKNIMLFIILCQIIAECSAIML